MTKGEWWFQDAAALRDCNPEEFKKDVRFFVDYIAQYQQATLDLVLAHGTDLVMLKPEDVDTDVRAFLKAGAEQKEEGDGVQHVDFSGDGTLCSDCNVVYWLAIIVCPTCIKDFGDDAPFYAKKHCWRCVADGFSSGHFETLAGRRRRVKGSHKPLLVSRLYPSATFSLLSRLQLILDRLE